MTRFVCFHRMFRLTSAGLAALALLLAAWWPSAEQAGRTSRLA
jgi:hypothetical protein